MTRGSASWITMITVLAHMQLARLRKSWRPYMVVSAVMPAGIVLLLHLTNPHMPLAERLNVVPGAMLLAQSIADIVMLSQFVAWLKASRALDHYRVLPVSLGALAVTLTLIYGLFSLPGVVVIGLEGEILDGLSFHVTWALLPAFLGIALALGAIGIIIGLLSPDEGLAGLFGNLMMMGVLFAGMVPISGQTGWGHDVLWLLPSTEGLVLVKAIALGVALPQLSNWLGLLLYGTLGITGAKYLMERPS